MKNLSTIIESIKNRNYNLALKLCDDYHDKDNNHIIHNLRGSIFLLLNDINKAEEQFLSSLKINPNFIEPIKNLYIIYSKKNDFNKSLIFAKKLFEIDKKNSLFNYLLGSSLEKKNLPLEAINYYENCIKLNGLNKKQALNNIGALYLQLNKPKQSLKYLLDAYKLDKDDKIIINNLLSNFLKLRDAKNIEVFYKKAKDLDQGYKHFNFNKANYCIFNEQIKKGTEILEKYKSDTKFLIRLIKIYFILGKNIDANNLITSSKDELLQNEDFLNFYGLRLLYEGHFEKGWKYYEHRYTKKTNILHNIKEWNGENLKSKTILIYNEQGLGDAIQFSKFIIPLLKISKNVIFLVQSKIVDIFKNNFQNLKIDSIDNILDHKVDFKLSLGSLIKFFYKEKIDENDLIEKKKFKNSKIPLKKINNKLKVGIAWSGSFNGPNEPYRSIPLRSIKKIFSLDVNFYCLQKEIWERDLIQLNKTKITNLGNYSLNDIVNIIQNLDLVISSDTSILHLAASLNKETWGLINLYPDWRWGAFNEIHPYKSLKIFRQKTFDSWDDVELDVYESLKNKINNK